MRMWMIDPALLCTKHLLGEHGEIHKHRHNFVKKHSITGRITPIVAIEPANMLKRHDELAAEMLRRGHNHKSPYIQPDLSGYPQNQVNANADLEFNLIDLMCRCEECLKNITEWEKRNDNQRG